MADSRSGPLSSSEGEGRGDGGQRCGNLALAELNVARTDFPGCADLSRALGCRSRGPPFRHGHGTVSFASPRGAHRAE